MTNKVVKKLNLSKAAEKMRAKDTAAAIQEKTVDSEQEYNLKKNKSVNSLFNLTQLNKTASSGASAKKYREVLKRGEFNKVPEDEVEYEFVSNGQLFNNAGNLLPLRNAVASARAFYGNKFIEQTLALKDPDVPYVQNMYQPGVSYEDILGRKTGVVALDDDDGKSEILEVTPDYIKYKNASGKTKTKDLYNHFNFNRKTTLVNTPIVKKGDVIDKKNAVLAKTNYTDNNGTLAYGKNARIAVVPYKGFTLDDAVVVSEEFAKKMTSHHAYKFEEERDIKGLVTDKNKFTSLFTKKYTKDQLDKLTSDGVPKQGAVLEFGDPIILSMKPRMVSSQDNYLGKLGKYLKNVRSDASQVWDHEYPGVVTDVVKTRHGWKVNVEAFAPLKVGDKLITNRVGIKNTVSKIIPQEQMPIAEDGEPVDVIFNQLGIPSRVAPTTAYEFLLGKVAEKTGKTYKLPSFNFGQKWYDFVKQELDNAGLKDVEKLYDPVSGKYLAKPVMVGNGYVLKLHHTSDSKLSSRGQGAYDANLQPAKGGFEGGGSKRMSGLETTGLLSAGANNVLKDALMLRGQKNDEYWRAVRTGQSAILKNERPFVWDKLLAMMKGTGINTIESKNEKGETILRASPFTDKQFDLLRPEELDNAELVDFKTLQPVEGGLFSPGRLVSNKWGKITLDKHYPNPGFEDAIASILGLKKKDMYAIIKGEDELKNYGKGSEALYNALENVDMDETLKYAIDDFKNGPKSKKNIALNRIRYISGLKENGLKPEDLMIKKVPVLPPKFRPYSIVGDTFIPGDVNELYQDLFQVNKIGKKLKETLGDEAAYEHDMNVYNALKALYGFDETKNKKLINREVSGFLKKLIGDTSKFGLVNRAVNSKTVDFTGRGVIQPDPELSIDQIRIPEDMAFRIYAPYVQRELLRSGLGPKDALEAIKNKTKIAKSALNNVLRDRVAIWSRAPAWHKGNTLGAYVLTHPGKNIFIHPLNTSSISGDFDGDCQLGLVYILMEK